MTLGHRNMYGVCNGGTLTLTYTHKQSERRQTHDLLYSTKPLWNSVIIESLSTRLSERSVTTPPARMAYPLYGTGPIATLTLVCLRSN